jgi:hypothetical protein
MSIYLGAGGTIKVMLMGEENLRVRCATGLKEKWDRMLEARKITGQSAFVSMMEFIVDADPMIQLLVFKQAPEEYKGQLIKLVLDRLAKSDSKGRK